MATQTVTPQPAESTHGTQESALLLSNQQATSKNQQSEEPLSPAALLKQIDDIKDPSQDIPIDALLLVDVVKQFLARYLECSEHQRTVLALWVLHSHALIGSEVTPYLAIQSAEKQSGKTLCLKLLGMLITHHALTAGFTPANISRRLDPYISTVLLDECQATVGTRARPKNPVLRALLAGGYDGIGYTDATHERNLFAPKAFAGKGQLPEEIADRSISIVLQPVSETSTVERYHHHIAAKDAKPLRQLLHLWAVGVEIDLEERPPLRKEDFPPNLSPRRRDMVEPLLQLADFIGGEWPRRIREAIPVIFAEQADFELKESLQLLADVRDCFAFHNYPERLPTAVFLDWLHGLPTRSWD